MNKVKISKEWTPEERLQLIRVIVGNALAKSDALQPWGLDLIYALTSYSSGVLETNRVNFREYLEDAQ